MDVRVALAADEALPAVLPLLGGAPPDELTPRVGPVEVADGLEALLCDPWDVPLLVERGAAAAGIVAKHVLAETRPDVYEVLDLGLGSARLAVLSPDDVRSTPSRRRPRIATTHPGLCRGFFAARGLQVETLTLRRAAATAVLTGVADAAVVVVGVEEDSVAGGLTVGDVVLASTARLIVNRSARVTRAAELAVFVDRVRVSAAGVAADGDAVSPVESAGVEPDRRLAWHVDQGEEQGRC